MRIRFMREELDAKFEEHYTMKLIKNIRIYSLSSLNRNIVET